MQAVVLCGGKGTRMSSTLGSTLPKLLTPLPDELGNHLLNNLLSCLERNGFESVLLICGHNSSPIIEYIDSNSGRYSIKIDIYVEDNPSGTANALSQALDCIDEEFILIMGDLLISADLARFARHCKSKESDLGLIVKSTDHPEDSDLVVVNSDWEIERFCLRLPDRSQPAKPNFVLGNSGIFYLKKELVVKYRTTSGDIHETLIHKACESNLYKCCAYYTAEYIKDIGSPSRWKSLWNKSTISAIKSSSREFSSGAVFVDKDDTIVRDELSILPGEFKFIPKTIELLQKYSTKKIIIISNQPAIAKGFITERNCFDYFGRLCNLLQDKFEIKIDGFYYCPHHPDRGFEGEIKSLKVECNCRKPNTEMVLTAAKNHNINLTESIFIGDSSVDEDLAGKLSLEFIKIV